MAEPPMDPTDEPCSSKDNNVEVISEENSGYEDEIQCLTKVDVDVTVDDVENKQSSQLVSTKVTTTQITEKNNIADDTKE